MTDFGSHGVESIGCGPQETPVTATNDAGHMTLGSDAGSEVLTTEARGLRKAVPSAPHRQVVRLLSRRA
jgi:hypothetical protein